MQFVPSTPIALIALVVLAVLGARRGAWALFALLPLGAAAAFNLPALGGASIVVADLAAVMVFALVLFAPGTGASIVGTLRPWQPGFFLAGVLVVSSFSAIFAPRFFAGATEVFGVARDETTVRIIAYPLGPSAGNITQLFRLFLDAFVFIGFATAFRLAPVARSLVIAMIVATTVNFVFGWIDVLTFATGTEALLEPIRTANYSMHITDTMVGMKRMIGGFPEASSFGFFSLGLFGFWLQYWVSKHSSRAGPWMLALATISVLRSTSSSAYVALVLFLVGFMLFNFFRHLRPEAERRSVSMLVAGTLVMWLAAVAAIASYELVPTVTTFLDDVLLKKLGTESGIERMSWNSQALINLRDTWGIGAGIGAVRASNWLIACLGSIGVVGTLLYIGFISAIALMPPGPRDDPRHAAIRGAKTAGFAMLAAAVLTLATPDLGLFFFALTGAATGLSRAVVLESHRHDAAVGLPRSGHNVAQI